MTPDYDHPFRPDGPLAYFITFRCYGTWLHGDVRGSVDRDRFNAYGNDPIPANRKRVRSEERLLKHPPVSLNSDSRLIVDDTIRKACAFKNWQLFVLNVLVDHVHVVLHAPVSPELVMNALKSRCTRLLRESGQMANGITPWSRHGSTNYIWTEPELERVCHYVMEGQG